MKEFYYQIKGKSGEGGWGKWSFPPIFTGKVSADSKKEAKKAVEDEYGKKFPLRVLTKDLDSNEFLLKIEEISDYTARLFEDQSCEQCGKVFRRIDLYNDSNSSYKGYDFCSDKCKSEMRQVKYLKGIKGGQLPVIYQITNSKTGKSYIGKTTQVFTLRWYQHFFHGDTCKFHQAIEESELEDWSFQIVETVVVPDDIKKLDDGVDFVSSREKFWIDKIDSIQNGYNSADIKKREE